MRRIRFAAVALAAGLAAGCGSSSTVPGTPGPAPTATNSSGGVQRFRVVNGSPGTGSVDIYIYLQGSVRPTTPTFSSVPFGAITPYVAEPNGLFAMDVLRAGAVSVSAAILTMPDVTAQQETASINSGNYSVVIEGVALNGTRQAIDFLEPIEQAGQSALVVHHASPAANVLTATGAIGLGIYSALTYPPGTAPAALPPSATQQLFSFAFQFQNAIVTPTTPNAAGGGFIYVAPFPISPLPAAVGFALGLPSTSAAAGAPLASVVANAALSETANENSPYANQNAITANTAETLATGTRLSEFLIDADQNGGIGMVGTLDP